MVRVKDHTLGTTSPNENCFEVPNGQVRGLQVLDRYEHAEKREISSPPSMLCVLQHRQDPTQ